MTIAEQHSTWQKFHIFQAKIEEKFIPIVLTPIKNSVNAFIDRGFKGLDDIGIAIKLMPVLNNLYYQCGYGYGFSVYKQYKNTKGSPRLHPNQNRIELAGIRAKQALYPVTPEEIAKEVVNQLRLSLLTNVHGIEQSVKDAILATIQKGQAEGWSYEKTAQEVNNIADIVRARRIVRTESVKASNMSAISGANATGFLMDKRWISAKDNRVRGNPAGLYPNAEFDHWDMNGVTIPSDQSFNVNGDTLDFPGDPKGSPGDIINCRCVCGFIPKRDERGRVIRTRMAFA